MRLKAIILALATCSSLATAAHAQRYYEEDRDAPRYDRGPPPREDYYRPRPDYDRPPPRFTCFVDPAPPYPGRSCGTPPGRPHSSCRCGPYFGHREFDRRD